MEERRAALAAGRCFLGATGVTPGLQSLTLAGFDADEALDLVAAVAAADPADHPLSFLMLVTPRLADDPMLLWRSQKPSPSYYSRPLTEELAEPCLRRLSEVSAAVVMAVPAAATLGSVRYGPSPSET